MASGMRARDLGLPFEGKTGPWNAITDVPGVEVGYATIVREASGGAGGGGGPVRTGVTAILPRGHQERMHPIWAGTFSLNGNGEMTGVHWIEDGGYFLGPVCLTNTHSVGTVHEAAVRWMLDQYASQFATQQLWALPVVTETWDGVLNDINGQHVRPEDARVALDSAQSGPVAEGNVGGGTGMICYGFKGGSGTASRALELDGRSYHVGTFVQANFGWRPRLRICGVPVGRHFPLATDGPATDGERGSIIVIVGTDIPMLPHQLRRVAKRAGLGIARTGTPGGNSSGDIFLAFSTANEMEIPQAAGTHLRMEFVNDEAFDEIYEATCAAVEEAVVNALVAAEAMTAVRPAGRMIPALDHDALLAVMNRYHRIGPELGGQSGRTDD